VTIAILDYGMGNLLSVERALRHVGADAEITGDRMRALEADALVVPGVGHFDACMRGLVRYGLATAVREFVASGRQVFGVCVGMQILLEGSEEGGEAGLGILPGMCRRLPAGEKVPHMGWNTVEWSVVRDGVAAGHPYVDGLARDASYYFVHSYAAAPSEDTIGITEHGLGFSAVVAHDNVFATQFHPEKSGDAGLHIYEGFAKGVAAA
jgi:imidazole glycerol-phosphate synthase subunit HisH